MARELNQTISELFRGTHVTTRGTYYDYYSRNLPVNSKKLYMDIPINQPVFEIPLFVFNTFLTILNAKRYEEEAIVVVLKTLNRIPRYVTLSRYMKDILLDKYTEDKLVKLKIKGEADTSLVYYATQGAIFNKDFIPVMMCSWTMSRHIDGNGSYKYDFLRPIMRIDPDCYLSKENQIEKFIVNKLPTVALETQLYEPLARDLPECFGARPRFSVEASLKIEIDECPFTLKHTDTPSISTTNEKLLQIAIDHIDELIQ